MDQTNSNSKLAGRAGSLIAVVGLLAFFLGVFSIVPRMYVFVGVCLYVVSLAAFYLQELGERRKIASR